MVAFDGSEACSRAEAYYHDLVESGEESAVPHDVVEHVQCCGHCQQRLKRLREALLEMEREGEALQSQKDRNLVGELAAQFEFLGEPLTCERVKPFLPSLLAPETQIRIPTPVTVHVDQCPECARDLESLRALDLSSEQLARLGRLYADSAADGFWICLRVQSGTMVGWSGSLEHADAKAVDHLCVCPRCRHRLYRQRQRLLVGEQCDSAGQGTLCCADVSDADLFDFVVPYGNSDALGADGRSRRCAEHIQSCPHCLTRAQQLHLMVYNVLERPDSGVVTVYRTRSHQRRSQAQAESPYGDYPVDVQVTRRDADETADTHARVRGLATFKPVVRIALTAAALIPLAVVFVMTTRSALGLSPRRLNEIAAASPCVHVTIFGEDAESVKEELWVSRTDGLLVSKQGDQSIIFDLTRKRRITIRHRDSRLDADPLGHAEMAAAEGRMETLLGISASSPIWNVELEASGESRLDGIRVNVYKSDWQSPTSGGASGRRKCEVSVDAATRKPLKVEFFVREFSEGRWVPEEMRRLAYPAAGEVRRQAEKLQPFE